MSESWSRGTLADLVIDDSGIKSGPFGTSLSAAEYGSEGVPVISVGEVGYGEFRLRKETPRVGEAVTSRLPEYLLREGDIVFGRKGAVDRSAWVSSHEAGWFLGSDGLRVRTHSGADSRFVAFQLRGGAIRDWLLQHAGGSTLLSLNQGTLARVPVVIPPLPEQQAIAEVLGALDDKIAANITLAASVDRYLSTEFEGRLRREATTNASLSGVATVVLGGTPSRARPDYWADGTVPWLNSGAANATRIVAPSEHITAEALAKSAAKMMPIGTTLIAITGATLGQVARLEIEASGNQSLVGVWSADAALNTWLYFAIRARLDVLLARATGAAQQHVSKGDVESLAVPLADRTGIQDFACIAMPLLDAAALAERENRTLATIRDALLPQLMSGKLRVRDAEEAGA